MSSKRSASLGSDQGQATELKGVTVEMTEKPNGEDDAPPSLPQTVSQIKLETNALDIALTSDGRGMANGKEMNGAEEQEQEL